MAVTSTTSGTGFLGTSDIFNLKNQSAKGADVAQKLIDGQTEIGKLGLAFGKLRTSLEKLKNLATDISRRVSDIPVFARSGELGLSYAAGNSDADKKLSTLAQFSGVTAGTVKVNGVNIAIDPATDTLNTVLARISASSAGVKATLSTKDDRVDITSNSGHQPLGLSEGSTGLFTALKLASRVYTPQRTDTKVFSDPAKVRGVVRDMADALTEIFSGDYKAVDADRLKKARDELRATLEDVIKTNTGVSGTGLLRTGLGINFDFRGGDRSVMEVDSVKLDEALKNNFSGVRNFIQGSPDETTPNSLSVSLMSNFDTLVKGLIDDLGSKLADTALVDIKA